MASPMEQFLTAKPSGEEFAGSMDLAFTNASLTMVLAAGLAVLVMGLAAMARSVVPGRMQAVGEMMYDIVAGMVKDNVGKEGRAYFPLFIALFLFILFANFIAMIPFFHAPTAQISVTLFMSMFIFIGVTLIGLFRHGLKFFSLFLPHGTPLFVAPIVIPIEIISYLSRPISLAVRLFANMVVGHVIMKVVAGFVVDLFVAGGVLIGLGLFAFAFLIPITALEFLVAALQAYIFTVLATIYLHDAIHLH